MTSNLKPIEQYELSDDRIKHIHQVTISTISNPLFQTLSEQEQENLILAAQYQDVGYATDILIDPAFAQAHYIEGFYFLQTREVTDQVCRLVLHHTYAKELERLKNYDLTLFDSNPLSPENHRLLFILNETDMTTDGKGNVVTKQQRLEDIANRYGDTNVVTEHFKLALQPPC